MVGYMFDMPRTPLPPRKDLKPINRWVYEAVRASGLSQTEIAARLAAMRAVSASDRSIINKMILGRRGVSAEEAAGIAQITGFTPYNTDSNPKREEIDTIFEELPVELQDFLLKQAYHARDLARNAQFRELGQADQASERKERK